MQLIHYGTNHYDPQRVQPIRNVRWVKPHGGLWTSPVDSTWGWRDWCRSEMPGWVEKPHCLLHFSGSVHVINSLSDLMRLPWLEDTFGGHPDFELLAQQCDALHLTVAGQECTRFSTPRHLYGWDCETVLVFNPHSLTQVEPATSCA